SHYAEDTIGQLSPKEQAAAAQVSGGGSIPDMDLLPPGIREWLESAYGHGIADIFLYVAPVAFLAFLVTLFIKEVPLKTSGALAQAAEEAKEKEKEKEQEAVPAVAGAGPVEAPEQP